MVHTKWKQKSLLSLLENLNQRVHCSCGKLGKVIFPFQWWTVRLGFLCLYWTQVFFFHLRQAVKIQTCMHICTVCSGTYTFYKATVCQITRSGGEDVNIQPCKSYDCLSNRYGKLLLAGLTFDFSCS